MSFDDLIEPGGTRKREYAVDPEYAAFYERPVPGGVPAFARVGMTALFLDAIDRGVSVKAACNRIGVNQSMWYVWEKTADQNPDGPHGHFVKQVRQKQAEVEIDLVDAFRATIEISQETGDHRGVLSFLERWNPDFWGPTQRTKQEVVLDDKRDVKDELVRRLLPELTDPPQTGDNPDSQ